MRGRESDKAKVDGLLNPNLSFLSYRNNQLSLVLAAHEPVLAIPCGTGRPYGFASWRQLAAWTDSIHSTEE